MPVTITIDAEDIALGAKTTPDTALLGAMQSAGFDNITIYSQTVFACHAGEDKPQHYTMSQPLFHALRKDYSKLTPGEYKLL